MTPAPLGVLFLLGAFRETAKLTIKALKGDKKKRQKRSGFSPSCQEERQSMSRGTKKRQLLVNPAAGGSAPNCVLTEMKG